MKLSKIDRENISKKNEALESVKPLLKKEFIGVDDVIDQIVDSIRPFYIFPQSLKRPLIVNLFGMTGIGKTHLVERMIEILNLKHKYFRFDIGDYAKESSDWKLKSNLADEVKKTDDKDLILVFDEFQFGRTIDETGKEVDRASLRPMWELIDSGVITTISYGGFSRAFDLYDRLKHCLKSGVKVEDGIIVEGYDIYCSIMDDCHEPAYACPQDFHDVGPTIKYSGVKKPAKIDNTMTGSYSYDKKVFRQPYFITTKSFFTLFKANPALFANKKDFLTWRHLFRKKPNELLGYIYEHFIMNSPLMKKSDYSQSLIFVIGNIDEAYIMSHSSDPDADPDIFYEHSLKISVPKMKNALRNRFRMEQIGRLGNNMIVYPALNSKSYRLIIDKHLTQRTEYFKSDFGIELDFTDSLRDILYKESVFPTQGVRPILSTFNTFMDSYVSKLISDLILNPHDTKSLLWDFDQTDPAHVFVIDGKEKLRYPVKLQIEKLRKSDMSENQLYTAAHEAGHAVMAMVALELIPKMVMSKTANEAEGFCRTQLPDTKTKEFMYKEMILSLGGREAELALFGENNLSNGAGSDLTYATQQAVTMIKIFGMGVHSYQIEASNSRSSGIFAPQTTAVAEREAIKLFNKAQAETRKLVTQHLDKIIELTEFLAVNSKIEQAELTVLADKWGLKYRDKDKYHNFRDMLAAKKSPKLKLKKRAPKATSHAKAVKNVGSLNKK